MKRFLTLMLSLIVMCCAVVCSVSMAGCQKKDCKKGKHIDKDQNYVCDACGAELEKPHTHEFAEEWCFDEEGEKHWKECSCGEVSEEDYHVDEDNDGLCDVCGYEMAVEEGGEETVPGIGLGDGIVLPPVPKK